MLSNVRCSRVLIFEEKYQFYFLETKHLIVFDVFYKLQNLLLYIDLKINTENVIVSLDEARVETRESILAELNSVR